MSALPPKADMCGATMDVRFGPIADMGRLHCAKFSDRIAKTLYVVTGRWKPFKVRSPTSVAGSSELPSTHDPEREAEH
jgi:hypothetical protein